MPIQKAKFSIGDIVKHKHFVLRGVIYDVYIEFNNSEEWYQTIPKNVIKIPLINGIIGIFFSRNQITISAISVATISGGIATDKFLSLL
jgi:hypothetical protein